MTSFPCDPAARPRPSILSKTPVDDLYLSNAAAHASQGRRILLACGHMRRPQGKQISSNENREAKSITCKAEAPRLLCVKFKKRSRPLFYLFGAQVLAAFFKNATPSLAEHRVTIFSPKKYPQI